MSKLSSGAAAVTGFCKAGSLRASHGAVGFRMPRFFFDLLIDQRVLSDLGGMSFQHSDSAKSVSDKLAHHLALRRSELRDGNNYIRVRDQAGQEIHRSPIIFIPVASEH